ncbi:CAAX prenyl protease Ecym_2709 [Eremothecium cymbalariae DBVPG|uniref:intramembrane prenyl-peptidase Rce1 n=1 Tax=Eremothecium cymbalariae (strain CBS 270.75 / DBVPG 7215 / KCTC 17166 / NRRL Y-17582) TaxID=931890 RepID=G8JPE8_ERECY|nr:Hypothetical protein Ecym_2709 [Eremothecium cymbalariae DBVPG\
MIISLAALLSFYISASYVAVLYFSSKDANKYETRRNDPRIIKTRMKSVARITLLNLVLVPWLLSILSKNATITFKECFLRIGIVPGMYHRNGSLEQDVICHIKDTSKALLLTAILYGPELFDNILYYLILPNSSPIADLSAQLANIWGVRNYIFAPITEELFYTSMILQTYLTLGSTISTRTLFFETPLFFGLAHIHHGIEMYSAGIHRISQILFSCICQMLYTSLFGCFTNFIYLKLGGNLFACILIHAFCNYMSFPSLKSRAAIDYTFLVDPKQQKPLTKLLLQIWKYAYSPCIVLAIWCFNHYLQPLTDSLYVIPL